MNFKGEFSEDFMQDVLKQLAPEPKPDLSFLTAGNLDQKKLTALFSPLMKRFLTSVDVSAGIDNWWRQKVGAELVDYFRGRHKQYARMVQESVERFLVRLAELKATNNLDQKAVIKTFRASRVRIVMRYTDEEALATLRLVCQDGKLNLRQQGILLHLMPGHEDTYKNQSHDLAAEAQEFIDQGRQREGVDLLDAACELFPANADIVVQVAIMLADLGELKRAIQRLEQGFQSFPDHWVIPYNAACYHCRLGDLQMGVRCLARAMQINPQEVTTSLANDEDLRPLRETNLAGLLGQALATHSTTESATTPAPKAAPAEWFYSFDGKSTSGHVSSPHLKELIRNGQLTPNSLVSRDGKTWSKASRLKGIEWPKK
jgi:tetratricopeptide (TPR) repeat protein